jgi:CRISPR system Cascade subunit CasE
MILTQAHIPYEIVARWQKDGGFRDSYAWHKRIWETFPDQPEASRHFLTRLDDTGQAFRLLILSQQEPIKPDWCPTDEWKSKTIAASFYEHDHYKFSLLANPTRKIVVRGADGQRKKNGQRIAIVTREDLIGWIQRKGEQHGFTIDIASLKTIPRPRQAFTKKGSTGTHSATEFIGTLTVTQHEPFLSAVQQGIGSAKAFGFGLLCLAPI